MSTSTPEFRDDFCDGEAHLFEIVERNKWERYYEDYDIDWDGFLDGYSEEEDYYDDLGVISASRAKALRS